MDEQRKIVVYCMIFVKILVICVIVHFDVFCKITIVNADLCILQKIVTGLQHYHFPIYIKSTAPFLSNQYPTGTF